MSSLSTLPARDLEQLSAYVDGELAPKEADRLRARLEQDADLRQALRELRQTTDLLGALPPLAAPRSFALSAERAGAHRRYPRLQFATALASLAFLLVVGMDVLTRTAMRAAPLSSIIGQVAAPASEGERLAAEPQQELKEQSAPAQEPQLAPLDAAGTPEVAAPRAAELAPTPAAGQDLPEAAASAPTTEEGLLAAEAPAATSAEGSLELPATGTLQPPGASYADTVATGPPTSTGQPADTGSPPATPGALAQESDQAGSGLADDSELPAGAQPAQAPPPAVQGPDDQPGEFRVTAPRPAGDFPEFTLRLVEAVLGAAALLLGWLTLRSRRRL